MVARKSAIGFDPKQFLSRVGIGRTITTYKNRKTVYAQGDPADSVFFVQSGQVKLSVMSQRGKEAVLAVVNKGEFFGEGCLTGKKYRLSTARAMGECQLMRLEKSTITRALQDEPSFASLFIAHLLGRTLRVEEDLVDQLFNSSEKRLARTLLLLANFGKDEAPEPILADVSQETLAEMIGTTRSRVSYFMNRFRKLGFISYNGNIEVHKSLLNLVLHEQRGISEE